MCFFYYLKKKPSFMMLFFSTQILFSSHFNTVNIYSDKFIRLSRSAKLAKISPNFQKFTYFAQQDNISLSSLSKKKESELNHSSNLSLLFLNQGLRSADLIKLRWYLKLLGINITQIPSRFWSNSLVSSKRSQHNNKRNLKRFIHGNILLFHTFWPQETCSVTTPLLTKTQDSFYDNVNYSKQNNDSIYYLYKLVQSNLVKNKFSFNFDATSLDNQLVSFFKDSFDKNPISSPLNKDNSFPNSLLTKEFFPLSSEKGGLSNPVLPWELLSFSDSKDIPSNSNSLVKASSQAIFDLWLKTKEKNNGFSETFINLFFIHLKTHYLLYAGLLNLSTFSNFEKNSYNFNKNNTQNISHLLFDNLDTFRLNSISNQNLNSFAFCQNNALSCFELFFFSCLNRKYLLLL